MSFILLMPLGRTVTEKFQHIMACTWRRWGGLFGGEYYNTRTDLDFFFAKPVTDVARIERSGIQDRYLNYWVPAFRVCYPAGVIERDAETAADLGEDELPRGLSADDEIPGRLSYPEVIDELRRVYPPRGRQGFTL